MLKVVLCCVTLLSCSCSLSLSLSHQIVQLFRCSAAAVALFELSLFLLALKNVYRHFFFLFLLLLVLLLLGELKLSCLSLTWIFSGLVLSCLVSFYFIFHRWHFYRMATTTRLSYFEVYTYKVLGKHLASTRICLCICICVCQGGFNLASAANAVRMFTEAFRRFLCLLVVCVFFFFFYLIFNFV